MSQDVRMKQIKAELHAVGVTRYGSLKSEVDKIPSLLLPDEHIVGAIYGNVDSSSSMMLATTNRLLFVDVRPMHVVTDEISYANVSDLRVDFGMVYAKVTLLTRSREFKFKYVNQTCARIFMNALETIALGNGHEKAESLYKEMNISDKDSIADPLIFAVPPEKSDITTNEIRFLRKHHIAVLETVGKDGYPYGATVFYFCFTDNPNVLHIITRDTTPSAQNIRRKSKVGLTVSDEKQLCTLHIQALAIKEPDIEIAQTVLNRYINTEDLLPDGVLPPALQMEEGGLLVVRISIQSVYMHRYKGAC